MFSFGQMIAIVQNQPTGVTPPPPIENSEPLLSNFRVEDANPNRVLFDSDKDITGLTSTGFIVTESTISTLTIDGDNLGGYFTMSANYQFWDNNTIRLESGDGTVLDFTMQHIVNNIVPSEGTGTVYYVATNGSDSNNGLSTGSPFLTLQKAVTTAQSYGDKIWIKAGSYGAESISGEKYMSTAMGDPIVVEGYKTTPGDITSNYFTYTENGTQTLLSSEMPLFTGSSRENGVDFWNFGYNSNYILRNIQLQEYDEGVRVQASDGMRFERMNMKNLGTTPASGAGTGVGFSFRGTTTSGHVNCDASRQTVKESYVMNASLDGYLIYGAHFLIEDCWATSQDYDAANAAGASTDYYFAVKSRFGIIKNSTCWKDPVNGLGHGGHGFDLKTASHEADFQNDNVKVQYNLIEGNLAINIGQGYTSRHKHVQYNVYRNNEAHADCVNRRTPNDDWIYSGGIAFIDGGSYNIYEGMYLHDMDNAISYLQTTGEHDPEPGYGAAQHHSTVRNSIIDNVRYVFSGRNVHTSATSSQYENKFYNNTITGSLWMYWIKPNNPFNWDTTNDAWNNIIQGVATKDLPTSLNTDGWQFDYNDMYSSWTTSLGTNSMSVNPDLDASYKPNTTFTSIDVPFIAGLEFDYDGFKRNQTLTTVGAKRHDDETP